jgi:hypothetical protein
MGLPTTQPPYDPLRFPSLLFLSSKKDPQVPENSTQSAPPSASVQARSPGEPCGQRKTLTAGGAWSRLPALLMRALPPGDADEDDDGPDQQVAAAGSPRKTMPRTTATTGRQVTVEVAVGPSSVISPLFST